MNYRNFFIFCFLLLFTTFSFSQVTIFVKYNQNVSRSSIDKKIQNKDFLSSTPANALKKANLSGEYFARNLGKNDPDLSRIVKLNFSDSTAAQDFITQAKADPSIAYVQTSNIYKIEYTPNDSLLDQQWALKKIKAFEAWNITQGSDSILIGLIDTGIDYLHPDLKNKIYKNPGENGGGKSSNGIDDDGNGFIDDYMGWDFTDRQGFPFDSSGGDYLNWDNNPMDENGHGTYIAGILAAETNNIIGIAGTAPKIKILNLRAFDPSGYGEEDDVAAAILYAVQMGVKVINMSFGDTQFSYVLKDVIKYAYNKGVVLVASSGNDGSNEPHYPSGYSEVICVGNSTIEDYVASSSNYGSTLDLVAPGTDILTTSKDGGYATVSGTSASAPFVSAAAGLILSLGNYTNEEVKQILKSTADDIEEPGWDIRSGAGRLNLYRALSVLAPSVIKFNNPVQDFATNADTISINATVLSAYFKDFSLFVGTGLNPTSWTTLINNQKNQFDNKNIYNLNVGNFKDSVYCLRMLVDLTTGSTEEERVNFYVLRSPPKLNLVFVGSAFYGKKQTIMASGSTNQPSVVKMYYKKAGSTNFNFITLDGFATNIQSVKDNHYGFVPVDLIDNNSSYDVYFEAENIAGLKTIVKNNNTYFSIKTNYPLNPAFESKQTFSLSAGEIYQNPINLTSNDSNEVVLRPFSNPKVSYIYKLNGNNFTKIDSMQNKIVKDFGDFNNNGKKDFLSYFVYNGFIYEQESRFSKNLIQKFSDTSNIFWPIAAKDLYGNNKIEILDINSDTSITVWNVNTDLSLSNPIILSNFTKSGTGGNVLDFPNAVVTDMDGDGKKEIWMADEDGDIFSYKINGVQQFQKDRVISTEFMGSSAYLTEGDYTGKGTKDMAVLLHSYSNIDIAPYYRLIIFNFVSDSLNVIYDRAFIDPATEFSNLQFQNTENSIRFADIENNGVDDLVLFVFPYSYIFRYDNGKNTIISYKENINSNSIFVGDLNKNGVNDVAFPTSQGIDFYEFAASDHASTPYNLSGYSLDSASIYLKWTGGGNLYNIFKGTDKNNLSLIDSTTNNFFSDTKVSNKTNYYYAVRAIDNTKKYPVSNLSQVIQVYAHKPAQVSSIKNETPNSLKVTFTQRTENKIENLHSFEVIGSGYPNSFSAASQYSYLLTFNNNLPAGKNRLVINYLKDYYGSPIKPDTLTFTVDTTIITQNHFFVTSHEILNPYKIKLVFNVNVDPSTVEDTANYNFSPFNKVASVQVDDKDSRVIYLNLDKKRPVGSIGKEYTLHVLNIKSSVETGNIPINSGAGSYIVLSSFANNLSDVYVYPNPSRILAGTGKVTFANLPAHAKITIFNLNGKKMKELVENNGDGGIEYNLKDENGNELSTGIYIFRVVQMDNSNNEISNKLGKFAVIK
jgi:hypothetical protein